MSEASYYLMTTGAVLILRTIDASLYSRFVMGTMQDIDVVKSIFERLEMSNLNWDNDLGVLQFEAMIVLSYFEMSIGNRFIRRSDTITTPLIECYRKIEAGEKPDNAPQWATQNHARSVIEIVEDFQPRGRPMLHVGIQDSVRRMELLYRDRPTRR